jgi:hypothetical protein
MARWSSRVSNVERALTEVVAPYAVVTLFAGSAKIRQATVDRAVEQAAGGGILVVHDACPTTLFTVIGMAGLGYCGLWLDPARSSDEAFREAAAMLAPSGTAWWWHGVRGGGQRVCQSIARRHGAVAVLPK